MKAKEIIGEGKWDFLGKLLQKGSAAAKAAEPAAAAAKGPGIAGKVGGKIIGTAAGNPIKSTIAGATAYNYFKDPDRSKKDLPTAVGDALGKTARQGWDLGSAAISSAFKDNNTAVATTPNGRTDSTPAAKPSSNRPEKDFARGDDQPVRAPDPDSETNSDSYVRDMERRIEQRYKSWPEQQNESVKKKFAVTEADKEKQDPLTALQRGIYGQESGSGKAKTNRPNYAGARGPMQIMPGTFDWIKKLKLIPQDYDINNPKHNKEAGDALIAHYYKKYDGDSAKVAAAYYAGPGAINKDGTINTQWRDKKNPNAPTVGQYIDQTLAKASLPAVAGTTALAGMSLKGSGAKPSGTMSIDKPVRGPNGEPLVQMPDFSLGFKVGDKFVPHTKQGYGQPVDYAETHAKAKNIMGISPAEALQQSNDELLARRAAVQRIPARSMIEPTSVVPKAPAKEPEKKPELPVNIIPPLSMANTPREPEVRKPDDAWDKFINTVTVGRVPPEEKERIRVPESINKEIQDILRLSGKR